MPGHTIERNGELRGYLPQYLNGEGYWQAIEIENIDIENGAGGVPGPRVGRGILAEMDLYGLHQALTVAHWYAAMCESRGTCPPEVRAQSYLIKYAITAELE